MTLKTEHLLQTQLDSCTKGVPGGTAPFEMGAIGQKNWNVLKGDLPLPLAVLRHSALEHNQSWFQKLMDSQGALFAPHGKTHMSPQLYQRQEQAGAWGVTVATVSQVQVYREHGAKRIILANELVGPCEIDYILKELNRDADFDFYCLVDSREGVEMLEARAAEMGLKRPLQVLLELGIPGQRCGVRDTAQARELALFIAQKAPHLSLRGVEAFEGLIMPPSVAEAVRETREFLAGLVQLAEALESKDLFAPGPILLSAGGTAYYDLVLEQLSQSTLGEKASVVVRSGCYLFHDSQFYRNLYHRILERSGDRLGLDSGPQSALEVWASVLSRPEPTRAVLGLGKRDISFDLNLPIPEKWFRLGTHQIPQSVEGTLTITGLNDQHAMVTLPADHPLKVGDLVSCGISHPCTTLDKWQILMVVDDNYLVTEAIRSFF